MPTLDNCFILSSEFPGGKREEYFVKEYAISDLEEKTPARLRERTQELAVFIPGIINTREMLFFLLQQEKTPVYKQAFGDSLYHQAQVLGLSIPTHPKAQQYLYYTALYEVLSTSNLHSKHDPLLEAEKKVYYQAKRNGEDMKKFLLARIGFFESILAHKGPHTEQIRKILMFLGTNG